MCWTMKGPREAVFAGKLKESHLFSGSEPPVFRLATEDENLIHRIHSLWRKKNHSRSQIRSSLLRMLNFIEC